MAWNKQTAYFIPKNAKTIISAAVDKYHIINNKAKDRKAVNNPKERAQSLLFRVVEKKAVILSEKSARNPEGGEMKKRILIIDQDKSTKGLYNEVFFKSDIETVFLKNLTAGLELLKSKAPIDGVILDYELLLKAGLETIGEIKSTRPELALILVGQGKTEEIIKLIKLGADDFIHKPFGEIKVVKLMIEQILQRMEQEVVRASQNDIDLMLLNSNRMVGQSEAIIALKRIIQKVAPLDATILILGETGTGKEVTAKMIHEQSPQKDSNFIPVHCGGIPDTLLESVLFGHEKGSFTGAYKTHKGYFEIANDGTIFLDEIGDTTHSFQVKLLRVLQDKQFRRIGGSDILTTNARIIAATNRDLKSMVAKGEFREDLYYRLNVISLRIPPLRERPDDIPLLVRHFIRRYSKKHNHLGVYLKPETMEIITKQPWNGNVRELENVIERLVALSDSDWIGPLELPEEYLQPQPVQILNRSQFLPYAEAKNMFEKEYIINLLAKTNGNVSQAAKLAKMPRQNLHLKIKKHNLRTKSNHFDSVEENEPVSA